MRNPTLRARGLLGGGTACVFIGLALIVAGLRQGQLAMLVPMAAVGVALLPIGTVLIIRGFRAVSSLRAGGQERQASSDR